jgi:Leucine-rich repeat (LRR) protein
MDARLWPFGWLRLAPLLMRVMALVPQLSWSLCTPGPSLRRPAAATAAELPLPLISRILQEARIPAHTQLLISSAFRRELLLRGRRLWRPLAAQVATPGAGSASSSSVVAMGGALHGALTRIVDARDPGSISQCVKHLSLLGEWQREAGGGPFAPVTLRAEWELGSAALASLLGAPQPAVTSLHLSCGSQVSLGALAPLSNWSHMVALSLAVDQTSADLGCLSDLHALRSLTVRCTGLGLHSVSNVPPQLTSLCVAGNRRTLADLDVTHCTRLLELRCNENALSALSLATCSLLTKLDARWNRLTALDLSHNPHLLELHLCRNQLTTVRLAACSHLQAVGCSGNPLSELRLGHMHQLRSLDLSGVKWVSAECLTLPGSDALERLHFTAGQAFAQACLAQLDNLSHLCLEVSGSAPWEALAPGLGRLRLTALELSRAALPQRWRLPGPETLPRLSQLTLLCCSGFSYLDCTAAATCLTSLTIVDAAELREVVGGAALRALSFNSEIAFLNALGIAACTQLERLECSSQELVALDLTACSRLRYLDCHSNQLTSLVLGACSHLASVDCSDNQLTELQLAACCRLQDLDCSNNALQAMDVALCTALTLLSCSGNRLSDLDLSGCARSLEKLACSRNYFTRLDLQSLTRLEDLAVAEQESTGGLRGLLLPHGGAVSSLQLTPVPGTGGLPEGVAALATLRHLKLRCQASGTPPNWDACAATGVQNLDVTSLLVSGAGLPAAWALPSASALPQLADVVVTLCSGLTTLDCSAACCLTRLCLSSVDDLQQVTGLPPSLRTLECSWMEALHRLELPAPVQGQPSVTLDVFVCPELKLEAALKAHAGGE